MNAQSSVFDICVEMIVYLLLYNSNDCIFKKNINVWVLAWLCKTKISWKSIGYIKTEYIYKDIAEDAETRSDTSY